MFAHRRQRLLAATLVLLGLLAWWFAQRTSAPTTRLEHPASRSPDYVVDGIRALIFDMNGQPSRRISAEQVRHYPGDDSNELEQPRLLVYDEQAPPWEIHSERGRVSANAQEVMLSGAVRAQRAAAQNIDAITFLTSEITLFPDDQFAETDRFVELTSGPNRLTAVDGMRFWYLEPMHGNFFGRVRARIATGPDADADADADADGNSNRQESAAANAASP